MRSFDEILFRARQEAANLWLWALKPGKVNAPPTPLAGLPDPKLALPRLYGTSYAAEVERLAEEILSHRFPILGFTVETGSEIEWRKDPVHGIKSGLQYFRLIPYLDFAKTGDHKNIWELSRHQHLVLLAQAHLLTGRTEYLEEIWKQVNSWLEQNPFQEGINWTSALEVGFRALSWTWVYHLAGSYMPSGLRDRFLLALYRHGLHLESNLSVYFSPNTHLLGEALALFLLGKVFPGWPRAKTWARTGAAWVEREMERQVREDGSHFEQSSYYHVYALDMFLFYAALQKTDDAFQDRLRKMADYLTDLMGPARVLPFLGDDDGGRLFHPYGPRDLFGRGTQACAGALLGDPAWPVEEADLYEQALWWLGDRAFRTQRAVPARPSSRLHNDSGLAVMQWEDVHVLVDCGSFGPGSAGHSHSDTLSLILRMANEEVLIDPGAYTYIADQEWRNRFRGASFHNTVRIANRDQAVPSGPFRWKDPPAVRVLQWTSNRRHDFVHASCEYGGWIHERRVLLVKEAEKTARGGLLVVLDEITSEGSDGAETILCEAFWHFGVHPEPLAGFGYQLGQRCRMVWEDSLEANLETGGSCGWRSRALGQREPAPVLRITRQGAVPVQLWTIFDLSRRPGGAPPRLEGVGPTQLRSICYAADGERTTIRFDFQGLPVHYVTARD